VRSSERLVERRRLAGWCARRLACAAHRYTRPVDITSLPGADLIRAGLDDAAAGRVTAASLLVTIGAPRLRRAGLIVPDLPIADPEHGLYELLAADDSDAAHSRYNALIRQLVSFERALECVA
jgi:hypothetical protein